MSSPSKGDGQSERLPFEPKQKKKKTPKIPPAVKQPVTLRGTSLTAEAKSQASLKGIPKVVSQRMVKRMALFSGIPTFLGMSSFFIFYLIVKGGVKIPPYVVLAVSLGFLGLGVIGLTYGMLSASWDEEIVGNALGWSNFKVNLGRTYKALRSAGQEKDYRET
jgi:hypothetical protein